MSDHIKRLRAENEAAIEQLREAIEAIEQLEDYLSATKLIRQDYMQLRTELQLTGKNDMH